MSDQFKQGDWSELKRLAEEAQSTFGSFDPSEAEFDFMAAITPDVILALIAENKQLREDHDKQWRLAQSGIQNTEAVLAENAKLRTEVEALRKDAERYRWLRSVENDVAITFGTHAWEDLSDEYMDAAIDAAMGKGGRADG
jgi:hypothetical protein